MYFFLGNKSGNRRTANIRSIGHSDLFSLSKEDLTDVLSEFPAAKRHLEEKGRQILTKMGMLEESEEGEEAEAEKVETKINRLESQLEILQTKLARLMVELESSNRKMQARVEQLEREVAALQRHFPEDGAVEEAHGRGEGVGGEVGMEREEAEGEEEEGSTAKLKKLGHGEEGQDVPKEGDGESTKSTKDDLERMAEGDASGQKEKNDKQQQSKTEKNRERGDDRPGKGDGAEIEPSNERQGGKEAEQDRENSEEEKDEKQET